MWSIWGWICSWAHTHVRAPTAVHLYNLTHAGALTI